MNLAKIGLSRGERYLREHYNRDIFPINCSMQIEFKEKQTRTAFFRTKSSSYQMVEDNTAQPQNTNKSGVHFRNNVNPHKDAEEPSPNKHYTVSLMISFSDPLP